MTKLYTDFATLYHQVYPSFIDYDAQFSFYTGLLQRYHCLKVLEVGCGTGQLAKRMLADGWDYQGMDLSTEMLDIARIEAPGGRFFQGDMRSFALSHPVEAIIIPARSISYLLENKDIAAAFSSFWAQLAPAGTLIFDFIDAESHFMQMKAGAPLIHHASNGVTRWERKSVYTPHLATGWTWNWQSTYYELGLDGTKIEIASDEALLRAFLPEELALLLKWSGFELVEKIETGSYAFKTHVFVAKKSDD